MKPRLFHKPVVSGAVYDRANSAFATTVMVVFFPVFFKQYWSGEVSAQESTFWLGITNGGASFVLPLTRIAQRLQKLVPAHAART